MIHRKINQFLKEVRVNIGKFLFDRKEKRNELDISRVKKIIFLMYRDKIGDSLVNTIMYKALKTSYPEIEITVLTGKAGKAVLNNNPDVDKIVLWENKKNIKNIFTLNALKEEKYDLMINLDDFNFFKSLFIVNKINAALNIGFNKEEYKLYDISIEWKKEIYHESDKCIEVLKRAGITEEKLNYFFYLKEEEIEKGKEFWENKSGLKIVINFYGASKHRSFTLNKAVDILEKLKKMQFDYSVGIVFPPNKKNEVSNIVKNAGNIDVNIVENIKTIRESAAIVKGADILITPETSLVHIASAFDIPQIAIYRDKTTKEIWAPLYDNYKMIVTNKRDINKIDTALITEGLEEFYQNKTFKKPERV